MQCIKCKQNIPTDAAYCHKCGWKQSKAVAEGHKAKGRGNGQGSVYKLANGKYMASITIACGKDSESGKVIQRRRRKQFVKKTDAVNYLAELRKEQEAIKKITLDALHTMFEKTKKYDKLSKSQKDKLKYAWERLSDLKFRPIGELTLEEMQRTIDSKVNTYYPARDMKTVLSHLYIVAIQHGYATRNPTEYIELPESEASKKDAWTAEEQQKFKDDYASGHEFTGYILIMIYAGLRYGELPIPKQNIFLDEHYMIGGIKTESGIDRQIPIADHIYPIVTHFYNKNKRKLLEMNQDNFYEQYWATIERLGVRKLNPHCCRHTYFTRLTTAGVHTGIITAAGGHKSYQTTIGYTHIPLEDLLAAVNKI